MTQLRGSDVATLRRINSRALLAALHGDPDTRSVTELAAELALSRPTVEAALGDLMGEGWVVESAHVSSGSRAGRPARRYGFAADAGRLLGIDVGPHTISGVLADLHGTVLHSERRTGLDLSTGEAAWRAIREVVAASLAAVGSAEADLRAITVGVPAIVGPDGEIHLTTVVPDWLSFDLPGHIREAFPLARAFFDNDAKLATLAEIEWGAVSTVNNAIYILVGRRIAAGLVINGGLARGAHGAAGEIGALASVGWASAYEHLVAGAESADAQRVFVAAAAGDAGAQAAIARFAHDVAAGIAALCLVVDPEVVVVGGGIGLAGEVFLAPLREELAALTLVGAEVQPSSVGSNAVALGALARSLAHLRATLLGLPGS